MTNKIARNLMCPITLELMVDPVLADDDNTYERSAILEHLATDKKSPIDRSTVISLTTLRFSKALYGMIEDLVATGSLPDDEKKAWHARKKVVDLEKGKTMFAEGRVLDAAKLGHPRAMGMMALRYYEGASGVEEDYAKAFDFATRAAKEGDGEGMYVLGKCYENGHGVAEDDVVFLKWYEEAAKKGDVNGMYSIGQCYSAGIGCVKDDAKAAAYFKSATDLGDCRATNELANCYYEGAGFAKNLTTARELFKKAADLKSDDGDMNLGSMMILGEGGAKEVGKGFTLIEKAANAGNEPAVAHLEFIEWAVKKWKKTGICKWDTTL